MKRINTYAFYDKKGRRLAVFCRFLEPETVKAEIFILTCSTKDQFNKATARAVYDAYINSDIPSVEGVAHVITPESPTVYNPEIIHVRIEPEKGELNTLINYCNANFYKRFSIEDVINKVNSINGVFIKDFFNLFKD